MPQHVVQLGFRLCSNLLYRPVVEHGSFIGDWMWVENQKDCVSLEGRAMAFQSSWIRRVQGQEGALGCPSELLYIVGHCILPGYRTIDPNNSRA